MKQVALLFILKDCKSTDIKFLLEYKATDIKFFFMPWKGVETKLHIWKECKATECSINFVKHKDLKWSFCPFPLLHFAKLHTHYHGRPVFLSQIIILLRTESSDVSSLQYFTIWHPSPKPNPIIFIENTTTPTTTQFFYPKNPYTHTNPFFLEAIASLGVPFSLTDSLTEWLTNWLTDKNWKTTWNSRNRAILSKQKL